MMKARCEHSEAMAWHGVAWRGMAWHGESIAETRLGRPAGPP